MLATVLTQWVRRLPAPLIPPGTYRSLVALGQQSMQSPTAGRASSASMPLSGPLAVGLPALIRSLPQPNLRTLHALVEVLEAVGAREATNRMSAANLALVFAPTVCRSEGGVADQAANAGLELTVEIPAAAHVLAELITHRAECFPPLPSVTAPLVAAEDSSVSAAATATSTPPARRTSVGETANWWFSAGGEQGGPVTGGRLAALLANGELTLSNWVFEGGSSDWQELSQVQHRLPVVAVM